MKKSGFIFPNKGHWFQVNTWMIFYGHILQVKEKLFLYIKVEILDTSSSRAKRQ